MRRFGWCVLACGFWLVAPGCALMHEMQPHRLWRWNRGPAPSSNPFFSISDPIPQLGESREFPEPDSADAAPSDESLTAD